MTPLRRIPSLTVTLLVLMTGLAPLLAGAEDEVPAANPRGAFLYLANPGMNLVAPAAGAPVQTKNFVPSTSGVNVVSNPATNYPMDWEAYKFTEDYVPSGDLVINVYYLTNAAKATFHYASFYVLKGSTILTQDARQSFFPAATVDANQYILMRGATTLPAGTIFKKGETLVLRLYVATEHAPGAIDPKVAFGSPTTPSSVYLPGFGSGGVSPSILQQKFFVDDAEAFSRVEPAGTAAKAKTLTGTKVDSYAMVSLAKTKVETAMVAASDASCQVHITFPAAQTPPATPNRGVQCEILVNGAVKGTNANTCAASTCMVVTTSANGNIGPTVQSLRLGIPFKGVEIPEGAEIQMRIGVLAPESAGYVNTQVLYGAANRQTGIQFGALVAGGEASTPSGPSQVTLSAEPTSASAAPGRSATFVLTLAAGGTKDVNVSLEASGNATATFESDRVEVGAGSASTVNLTVTVPNDAAPGQEIPMLVHALVDDQEAANLTLMITVVQAEAGATPTAGPGAGGSGANSTEKATAKQDTDKKGVPGLEVPGLALGVLAAGFIARRRRNA